MVGIGGGVPGKPDIRLGDVVVGEKVIQHDLGKIVGDDGFEGTGTPCITPHDHLKAITKLRAIHEADDSSIPKYLRQMHQRYPKLQAYQRPKSCEDRLFLATYEHGQSPDCNGCSQSELCTRPPRKTLNPEVHYGCIASGNQVVKNGKKRDEIAKRYNVICFEMEAAGLIDNFPCIVIRGICDYADSHKNKEWQQYAAATAAACAKELVFNIPPKDTNQGFLNLKEAFDEDAEAENNKITAYRRLIMESIYVEETASRISAIKTAYTTTCDWLLSHPSYQHWLNPAQTTQHRGLFWISGKPGAGKSTIMKFALSHATRSLKKTATIIHFFFNARGGSLERSTDGLYRSLLHQLLERFPDLERVLDGLQNKQHQVNACPPSHILRDLLKEAVLGLASRHLICFVDALDECDEDEVGDMVIFFQDLGAEAHKREIQLNVCFSSRHYPRIDVRYGVRLVLEHQHGHHTDLQKYIKKYLWKDAEAYVRDIRRTIFKKSGGIFMWVVLVVSILNKEFRRGRWFAVEDRLRETPAELSEIFKDLLKRDQTNTDDLLLCVQLLLCAKRPLKLEEFYFALQTMRPRHQQIPPFRSPSRMADHMKAFIESSSKGLAEVTDTEPRIVQFIHGSVGDFLLENAGLQQFWPGIGGDFEAMCHETLKKCCLSKIGDSVATRSPPEAWEEPEFEMRNYEKTPLSKIPFLEYATENVLYHSSIAVKDICQDDFLDQFPLRMWTRLGRLLKIRPKWKYQQSVTLTYVLAENNLVTLLQRHVSRFPHVHPKGEHFGYPLFAALARGHHDAAKILLGEAAKPFSHAELFPTAEYKWTLNYRKACNTTPLHWALETRHNIMARLLIDSGQFDLADQNLEGRLPIHSAAIGGDDATLIYLLEKTVASMRQALGTASCTLPMMVTTDARDRPVLCSLVVVRSESKSGQPPLSFAVDKGHESMIQLLINWGASINDEDEETLSRLAYVALRLDSLDMPLVQFLVGRGMFTKKKLLVEAVRHGFQNIVERLAYNEEHIQSASMDGRTPLDTALRGRYWTTIKTLVQKGHVTGLRSRYGHDALHYFTSTGDFDMVTVLLDRGVEVNCKDSCRETLIHRLVSIGDMYFIQLFIESGVDVDSQDRVGRTPLHEAVCDGCAELVMLLLYYGATVNCTDVDGRTPLHDAVSYGHEDMTQLLIAEGARASLPDRFGRTALQMASQRDYTSIVELLRQNDSDQATDDEEVDNEEVEDEEMEDAGIEDAGIEDEEEEYFTAVGCRDSSESPDESRES
ncbi:Ankyrin-1 [Colletotrichum aenigma]|uniref:Ankyrin-1 n=1 Tax=Colletotrichum aenigma TaxID=1215731 RepID=UPI0018723DB6|nr:Ankyrin-1 [Colletotrichum aenigma]KAF5528655.1 Ankyrin-1 [Colletotrichum aenigma]